MIMNQSTDMAGYHFSQIRLRHVVGTKGCFSQRQSDTKSLLKQLCWNT